MSDTSNNNYNSKLVIAVITIAIFTRLLEAIPLKNIWRIPVKGQEEHNTSVPGSTDFLLLMEKRRKSARIFFYKCHQKNKTTRIWGREMNGSS
ncbi:MAG TPA: hypothetical protein VFD60_02180 [Nitrososphaeraceae archaeon]|jgi:hypothetical protein|nr:hypothetical protein [Nitrososphaeraceae archaeon]